MFSYRLLALPILAFPLILFTGIIMIPVVSNYANHDLAQEAAQQTKRWFWGHLLSGVAFGVGLLALFALALILLEQEITLWPVLSLPCVVIGATLLMNWLAPKTTEDLNQNLKSGVRRYVDNAVSRGKELVNVAAEEAKNAATEVRRNIANGFSA